MIENPARRAHEFRKPETLLAPEKPVVRCFGRIRISVKHDDPAISRRQAMPKKLGKPLGQTMLLETPAPWLRPPDKLSGLVDAMREKYLLVGMPSGDLLGIFVETIKRFSVVTRYKSKHGTVPHPSFLMGPVVDDAELAWMIEKWIQRVRDHDIEIEEQCFTFNRHVALEQGKAFVKPLFRGARAIASAAAAEPRRHHPAHRPRR